VARPRKPRARRPGLGERLRADFLTGLAVVLPAGLTVMLVRWALGFVDHRVAPFLPGWLGEGHLAGIGVVAFVAVATLVGALIKGYAGRRVLGVGEALVARLPVVRPVYVGAKQIVETAVAKGGTSFREVCLLEYPERGIWTVVVVTAPTEGEVPLRAGEPDLVGVLVPTAPNPITGFLIFAPRRDLIPIDLSLEDAAKLVFSAGMVGPPGYAPITPGAGRR
jgi:uncharacterized membrane protein